MRPGCHAPWAGAVDGPPCYGAELHDGLRAPLHHALRVRAAGEVVSIEARRPTRATTSATASRASSSFPMPTTKFQEAVAF